MKLLVVCLLTIFMLTGCIEEEGLKDHARSQAFTKILQSKQKKSISDFESKKITKGQLQEYGALLGKLLELEKNVRSGY